MCSSPTGTVAIFPSVEWSVHVHPSGDSVSERGPFCCDSDHQLTRLSSSGSSLKNGFPSFSWQRTKFSMSTSKLAEVMQSELSVDCSHFSKSSASRGKSGCLRTQAGSYQAASRELTGGASREILKGVNIRGPTGGANRELTEGG